MEDAARPAVPAWFWIVAVLALLWEAMGCFSYLGEAGMVAAAMMKHTPDQEAVWGAMPVWAWCAFAVAVWVGLSGALLMLMRMRLARAAFVLSLIAAIAQFGWAYLLGGAMRLGPPIMPGVIIVVGVGLVWFSDMAAKRGWLR
jgi:hypothetical protein